MYELKMTFKRLALYYLLLIINIIPCAAILPDEFPIRNMSTIYLLFLSVCLIRYYTYRVAGTGQLPFMMRLLSWISFLLLLLRGIKYSVFAGVDVLARYIWYLYYVPMLLLPLFFFYISLIIFSDEYSRFPKKWLWTAAITIVFILLVLTNDIHQLIFRFKSGFVNWDGDYSRGLLFYIITVWQYALYIAAVITLWIRCRVGSSKKNVWIIMIPFFIGIAMNVLLMTGMMPKINGIYIIEFPEALICMAVCVLECCIQLGLIPTNKGYGKLFGSFPLSVQITDRKGKPVFLSSGAKPLTEEQFAFSDGARIEEHTVLHKIEVPGGFGLWQDDMTELDRLNDELAEAKESLEQEAELTRLKNELKEKQIKIEQRNEMYDAVAKRTRRQSAAIAEFARTARETEDKEAKEKCRKSIVLLASCIKRYANLMLLSYESKMIQVGELGLSFSEVLRYLNFAGIPGELISTASGEVSAEAALAVFNAFGALITYNLSCIRGAFINLSGKEGAVCKLTLENLQTALSEEDILAVIRSGAAVETAVEDGVTYISFALSGGGEKNDTSF